MPEIIKITNPEALELIAKIKSGDFIKPLIAILRVHQYKILAVVGGFLVMLAVMIGLSLGETPAVFYNPDSTVTPTPSVQSEATQTEVIRRRLIDTNLSLPDPALPVFESRIDLQAQYYD